MKTPLIQKAKQQDWHRADIKSALEKAGWTLASLGKERGYVARSALVSALNGAYPKAERIIAAALGTTAQTIWPSRYNDHGEPISGRKARGSGLINSKFNTATVKRNVELTVGN